MRKNTEVLKMNNFILLHYKFLKMPQFTGGLKLPKLI